MNAVPRFAVFGHPIAHSLSPRIHQHFAQSLGLSLQYDKVDVPPQNFQSQVQAFFAQGGKGLNITVPFKTQAWEMAERLTPFAQQVQAVNTLWVQDGQLWGDNTDGPGLLQALHLAGMPLQNTQVLLLGAGGAAQAAAVALLQAGVATLWVYNRSGDKIQTLGEHMRRIGVANAERLQPATAACAPALIINATSSSLQGQRLPLPAEWFQCCQLAYDMFYTPSGDTVFLAQAREQGVPHTADGFSMLVAQAAVAFERWHGVRPTIIPPR